MSVTSSVKSAALPERLVLPSPFGSGYLVSWDPAVFPVRIEERDVQSRARGRLDSV